MASANATRALLKTRYPHTDIYVGTAQQLCAAGLARLEQFPGQPGRNKVRATYFLADNLPVPAWCSSFEPTYTIERLSTHRFSIAVEVGDDEEKRRKQFVGPDHTMPLDLPGVPAIQTSDAPSWAPEGWTFRRHRASEDDYVFVAAAEQLKGGAFLEGHPLPAIEDERRKTLRFRSDRFGWVAVSQRAGSTFFVVLNPPSDIRCAEYSVRDYGHSVCHTGTKQQLQSKGLAVNVGFPGEEGCNVRRLTTLDPTTGAEVRIELLAKCDWWGDVPRFVATVRRSEAEQEAVKKAKQEALFERGRLLQLKTLPATAQEFRDDAARTFWTFASAVKAQLLSQDGYRLTDESVERYMLAVKEAFWAIKKGDTCGRSPRDRLQQELSAKAKANMPLQRFLSSLGSGPAH